ncbi:FMN adenylyltransferase; riboflavin kinase [Oceanithermus profundus DSM 14977]|uniref:Riboflavin biosynthesis protein n=1 Tax=Oceanithermus profundus (strain DSM 14977 / NBRC 100410 / VKM B-2274 / 506) TaxID=670487 RepID=E4U7L4_OCEP5|nr:FMN adenylyltransferase; riboflavin kinase [Oceanithermus profundus DSM 14977]
MIIAAEVADLPPGPKVVAVGSFDGVHLGHQSLLAKARALAAQERLPLLVYTFDPPTKVFMRGVGMLSTLSEKLDLLREQGVDLALAVPFDEDFAARDKAAFLDDLVRLEARRLVVGEDFAFGRGRSGGPADLKTVAPTLTVPLLDLGGAPVKSTRIRELLEQGDVEAARHLLGRPYGARGIVRQGERLGRRLGFPTANVETAPGKVLPRGVFAARTWVAERAYPAVVNVGTRPTVRGSGLRLEAHLIGFSGELYGHELRLVFLKKLRDERAFEDLEALRSQIARDLEAARRFFRL